jgi:hypothetical protein
MPVVSVERSPERSIPKKRKLLLVLCYTMRKVTSKLLLTRVNKVDFVHSIERQYEESNKAERPCEEDL